MLVHGRDIELAELFELRLPGVEADQISSGIAGTRQPLEHDLGIDPLRPAVKLGGQQGGRIGDAPAAGIAGIFQRRQRQLQFGVRQPRRIVPGGGNIRQREVVRRQSVGICGPDRLHQRFCLRCRARSGDPDTCIVACRVKGLQSVQILLLAVAIGHRQGGQLLLQGFCKNHIDSARRRRRHSRRRWLGRMHRQQVQQQGNAATTQAIGMRHRSCSVIVQVPAAPGRPGMVP